MRKHLLVFLILAILIAGMMSCSSDPKKKVVPTVSISSTSHNYGQVPINATSANDFIVTNSLAVDVTLTVIAMGGTDARLWRYEGVPAYVYGPYAKGMGGKDDYVEVDEFIDIVKVHVLSAFDYLS